PRWRVGLTGKQHQGPFLIHRNDSMAKGQLLLVLHAHLPYVHHPEYDRFLEERWYFEAVTETYIPLIKFFDRLQSEGVPFKLTLSISPTLANMMEDSLLRQRCLRHLELS